MQTLYIEQQYNKSKQLSLAHLMTTVKEHRLQGRHLLTYFVIFAEFVSPPRGTVGWLDWYQS